jgi:hypothetical protein
MMRHAHYSYFDNEEAPEQTLARVESEEWQRTVDSKIHEAIDGLGLLLTDQQIEDLITAISQGFIPHMTINYIATNRPDGS